MTDPTKPRLSLVPPKILFAIESVRQYGIEAHKGDTWRDLPVQEFYEACFRHMVAIMDGQVLDPESGRPHLWHIACNIAFIIELESSPIGT